MPKCIYCLRTDPPCGFNQEHVIPQALGKFEGDVVTLTEDGGPVVEAVGPFEEALCKVALKIAGTHT
jgi:hypothetical protein